MFTMKIGIYENRYTDVPCDMIKRTVEDVKEASTLYRYLRDRHESLGDKKKFGFGLLLEKNKIIGYVSYNGNVTLREE